MEQHAERTAALQMAMAVAETIRDLSKVSLLGGVPSGELYAALMGRLNIQQYEAIISALKGAGLVDEKNNHLLTWTGPAVRNDCPDCGHPFDMHKRWVNGAYRCSSFGCGCEQAEMRS